MDPIDRELLEQLQKVTHTFDQPVTHDVQSKYLFLFIERTRRSKDHFPNGGSI